MQCLTVTDDSCLESFAQVKDRDQVIPLFAGSWLDFCRRMGFCRRAAGPLATWRSPGEPPLRRAGRASL